MLKARSSPLSRAALVPSPCLPLAGQSPRARPSRLVLVQPQASSSTSAAGSSEQEGGKKKYAFLHDFCMTIPYGAIVLVLGALSFLPIFKTGPIVGGGLLALGSTMIMLSILSLRYWRDGKSSKNFTAFAAGVSGLGAYWMYQRAVIGLTPIYSAVLSAVSAALAVFCVYNIFAGGNPPKGSMSH